MHPFLSLVERPILLVYYQNCNKAVSERGHCSGFNRPDVSADGISSEDNRPRVCDAGLLFEEILPGSSKHLIDISMDFILREAA